MYKRQAFAISNQKAFYISFFAIMPHLRSHGYGKEIIDKLTDFYQRTMLLEVERLDEECDNLEQRKARMSFYQQNGFKTANAFLEMCIRDRDTICLVVQG